MCIQKLVATLAVAAGVSMATAANLTIPNAGFETPVLSSGQFLPALLYLVLSITGGVFMVLLRDWLGLWLISQTRRMARRFRLSAERRWLSSCRMAASSSSRVSAATSGSLTSSIGRQSPASVIGAPSTPA